MSEKEHIVSATLTPQHYSKFMKVKKDVGFRWNSNVLRYLISLAYEKVIGSGRVPIPLAERDWKMVSERVEKLGVTPQQLVEEALTEFLKRKKEQYGS